MLYNIVNEYIMNDNFEEIKDELKELETIDEAKPEGELEKVEEFKRVPIKMIHESPYQGRLLDYTNTNQSKKDVADLVKSISENGQMQPVVLRKLESGFELIDGHRRLLACEKLGKQYIKAMIKQCTEKEAMTMSVIGNLQRKNLNLIELAISFQKLLDTGQFKSTKDLSRSIGKDATYVGDVINTLNMDKRILTDLAQTAKIKDLRILRLIRRAGRTDDKGRSDAQWEVYKLVTEKKLSRAKLSKLIAQKLKSASVKPYQIIKRKDSIRVSIDIKEMDEEKKNEIIAYLEEKLSELTKQID